MEHEPDGAIRLKVADANHLLSVLEKYTNSRIISSAWRHQVDSASRVLYEARANQIDGNVTIDSKGAGTILGATIRLADWFGEILLDAVDGGES